MHRSMAYRHAVLCATIAVDVLFLALAHPAHAVITVFSVGGDAATSSIQAAVDAFRAALGNPNNGNAALGPNDSNVKPGVDVVAMDDFLYCEPVPEPATLRPG